MDNYIGEIRIFGGNFAPKGWALCDGSLLSISQNAALFSLLGTTYGGNGVNTFGLPDLRGRVPLGMGTGTGLPAYVEGQTGGANTVTLTQANLPAHNHLIACSANTADQTSPVGSIPAVANTAGRTPVTTPSYTQTASTGNMASNAVSTTGGNQPVNVQPPFIAMNYIIALQGVYPSRN